jgi:hypothetical protein
MINVASITLLREGDASAFMNPTRIEEVRGFNDITWTSNHVVFNMNDGTIIAYKATRVHELETFKEKEE